MTVLGILWYFLIFLLIAGYFVLDGFDLGAGILYPFICKDEHDQAIVRRAIGPVWDGNEVWLLTAGGALFAAFPDAYATTFSGFYLAIMLVLFALIVRAVCFEFWAADVKWRKIWNACFFLGSALPALLFGVALGNVIAGIPMDASGNYSGVPLLGLLSPFTLLCGVLGLVLIIGSGAAWLCVKTQRDSALYARAKSIRAKVPIVALCVFVLASVVFFVMGEGFNLGIAEMLVCRILFAVLFVLAIIVAMLFAKGDAPRADALSFVAYSLGLVALVFMVACSMFPTLVCATSDSVGAAITVATAGSSGLSLFCMTVILCIGLPLVLAYHVIIYRTFRGRITDADLAH